MNQSNNKTIRAFILIMISVIWAATASAQSADSENIIPGSDELRLEKVQPYSYEFQIFMINDGKETLRGTLTDEVRIPKQQNVIERIQTVERPGQPLHKDSVRASLKTLAPISHSSVNSRRTIELFFEPSRVEGEYQPAGSTPITVNETFDHPYFDSNWVDFTIRLLPLELGYQATLLTHEVSAKGESGFVPYSIEVIEKQRIEDADQESINVWVVRQTKGGRETLFFIKENSRELVKMEIPISASQKMVMRRIS